MPQTVSVKRVIAMVNALMKLHNYCINDSDPLECMPRILARDVSHIMNKDDGYVEMIMDGEHDTAVPLNLLHAGHHYNDVPSLVLKAHYSANETDKLPRNAIHNFIANGHWERPLTKKRKSRA